MDEIFLKLAESEEIEKGDCLSFRFFNHCLIINLERDYSTRVERAVPLELLRQGKAPVLQMNIQELITEINLIQ